MYSFLLFGCLFAKNVILIPKPEVASLIDVNHFATEHRMESFASFNDDLQIYKMNINDYSTFEKTLYNMFYVEPEQVYKAIDSIDSSDSDEYYESSEPFILVQSENSEREVQETKAWHLDRIVSRSISNDSYPYDQSGSCHLNKDLIIDTYVIDTGIDIKHPEFEGRAKWAANFIDDEDKDCNSHGTHCAGLVGSKTYGVCKDANLFAVKVLNCDGAGSTTSVIKGIEYAYKQHLENYEKSGGKTRSVVSMSLGGGFSRALNMAVKETLKHPSFYFAAAAGNEDNDACKTSPASVKEIFTVMASDKYDKRAYFSNWGKCADIYSPGVDIYSTVPGDRVAKYSGTSMATPILAGVLNHYIDQNPTLNMQDLKKKVLSDSTKDILVGNPKSTRNSFVFLNRK